MYDETLKGLRFKKFTVLNDGFVTLIDVMGDDSAIVQAARVSYGTGTKSVSDDRTLIRYLLRHQHTTPFEMCELKFLVRVPMDCWRQWIRHRTASVNEYSTRYSEAIDSRQTAAPDGWRVQSRTNKQGSSDEIEFSDSVQREFSRQEAEFHHSARVLYESRLAAGIAREQARKDLPLSTYTEAYWKIDLHNLLRFLHLRMTDNAQYEIRQYAAVIGNEIVADLFPETWEAWNDYVHQAVTLTIPEQSVVRSMVKVGGEFPWQESDVVEQVLHVCTIPNQRERMECIDKLVRLGMVIPDGSAKIMNNAGEVG